MGNFTNKDKELINLLEMLCKISCIPEKKADAEDTFAFIEAQLNIFKEKAINRINLKNGGNK